MSSLASHVIPTEGLLKFRYYYFVRHFGKDVMFRVFKYCFLHGNSRTVREILDDNGVQLGRKSVFNAQEVTNLTSEPPESLDITVLNKICQALWQKMVNYPGDKLRDLIRGIKDERNAVSHEEGNITQTELENKLLGFESVLKEALEEAKALYPSHSAEFDQLELDIQDAVPKVQEKIREKYDPSNPDHVDRLKMELEAFSDQLRDYIQEKSRKELISLYVTLCRILPFDWLTQYGVTDPCEIMMSVRVDVDDKFHDSLPSRHDFVFDQKEILSRANPSGEDPKVIIVSGGAGTGKTTMLCSIVEKWHKDTNDMANLSSFQILLYMEFRKDDYDNFEDYIRDLLQRTVLDLNFELVKTAILHSKCLILCDGFDEANKKSKKLFEEILRLNCKDMKILVTTRPLNTVELTNMVNKSKHHRINLSMLGIPKSAVEGHVKTLATHLVKTDLTKRDVITREIIQFLKVINNEMNAILRNPLWLNLFVLLYIECPNIRGEIDTVSSLYTQLKLHSKKRLIEKFGFDEDDIEEYEVLYKKYSLECYLQQKYELSHEDAKIFKKKLKELDLDFNTVMSSYYNIKHTVRNLEVVKIFCYRHRSEQEYTAASAICDELIKLYEDDEDKFDELKKKGDNIIKYVVSSAPALNQRKNQVIEHKHLDGLIPFVCGILYNKDVDLLNLVIEDIIDANLKIRGEKTLSTVKDRESFIKYFTETRNDVNVINAAVKVLKNYYGGSIKKLQVYEVETLPTLPLFLPEITVKELALYLRGNPEDFTHLNSTLEAANRCNTDVMLLLSDLWVHGSDGNADNCLDKSQTCVKFHGRLTENGILSIPKCIVILRLRVDLDALRALSVHVQDLKQLKDLELKVHDDGSTDPHSLSTIDFRGEMFIVEFFTSLDVTVSSNVVRTAEVLNAFWPQNRTTSDDEATFLYIPPPSLSKFSGDGLRLLGTTLAIRSVSLFVMYDVSEEAYDKEEEFCKFFQSKGFNIFQLAKTVYE